VPKFPNLTDIYHNAFYECTSLDDVSGIDFSKITKIGFEGKNHAFIGCTALLPHELAAWNADPDKVLAYLRENGGKPSPEFLEWKAAAKCRTQLPTPSPHTLLTPIQLLGTPGSRLRARSSRGSPAQPLPTGSRRSRRGPSRAAIR
jgi:hypothetical protein